MASRSRRAARRLLALERCRPDRATYPPTAGSIRAWIGAIGVRTRIIGRGASRNAGTALATDAPVVGVYDGPALLA